MIAPKQEARDTVIGRCPECEEGVLVEHVNGPTPVRCATCAATRRAEQLKASQARQREP